VTHWKPIVVFAMTAAFALVAHPRAADERTSQFVLSRITFGARPGDAARVRHMGVDRFIDEQLHPERVTDSEIEARLNGFETLALSSREIAERYEVPAMQARRARQQQAGAPDAATPQQMAASPERERANLPLLELSEQKIIRATYSERQLQEVLVDFWFNHFNVDARKGPSRYLLTEYERDVIRPHVLGRFRDLLGATAKSPAMLFYLDNWMSTDPNAARPDRRPTAQQAQRRATGLNENYGRELLELHTLGADGGYTQTDVSEVARAFTGWTIDLPRLGGGFRFAPGRHDNGEKVVLGHHISAGGGERDGEQVLDILAAHPSTARLISTSLARGFVSDDPPKALIERMASTFLRSGGDLRAVMTVVLTSAEFLSPDNYRAKVKSPFEFVVSSLRVTGANVEDAKPLVRTLQQLGMPLYQCQPPTGYRDTADAWMNTGALVNRLNVALMLADGRLPGITLTGPAQADALIGGDVSVTTLATIAKAHSASQALALALGSPEFQRR
jgi:uncharacterized protein (DUF1800 family)